MDSENEAKDLTLTLKLQVSNQTTCMHCIVTCSQKFDQNAVSHFLRSEVGLIDGYFTQLRNNRVNQNTVSRKVNCTLILLCEPEK